MAHIIMSFFLVRVMLISLILSLQVSGAAAQTALQAPDRSWRKAVPEITWQNISPPFKEYSYYDHVERFPFEIMFP